MWAANFGVGKSIEDPSFATRHGIRVALPVTTTRPNAVGLFTNYNGVGIRPPECGKILSHTSWASGTALTSRGKAIGFSEEPSALDLSTCKPCSPRSCQKGNPALTSRQRPSDLCRPSVRPKRRYICGGFH